MPSKYPDEFRRRAVELVRAGQSVPKAAADLGITDACLYGWVKQDRIDRGELPVESRRSLVSLGRLVAGSERSRMRSRSCAGRTGWQEARLGAQRGPTRSCPALRI